MPNAPRHAFPARIFGEMERVIGGTILLIVNIELDREKKPEYTKFGSVYF